MFFLYGIGSSTLGPFPLPSLTCVYCGTHGSLTLLVLTRYLHFFWIPVFPFQKKALTVCAHCQQALTENEWPAQYQQAALARKQQTRFPLTNFAGLLILGVLLGVGLVAGWFSGS